MKKTIQNFKLLHKNEINKGLIWDALKCEIRGMTISYSSMKSKERRALEKKLLSKIESLEKDL